MIAEGRFLWKMCIDTGAVSGARTARGRLMPTAPAAFALLLQSKIFTNSADHDQVAQLYRDTADAVTAHGLKHWTGHGAGDPRSIPRPLLAASLCSD